ncbi:MAG TPA: DHH family phosphoesterase [Candidatus Krumholzibacteriaceae bacterium]|nr:DHH family phosphoesterase [Candidatus Krumholzibacteriaceae bacterium]
MQINQIIEIIDQRNATHALLLCHHNADPDALCSAYAMAQLLQRIRPQLKTEIAAAEGPSHLSKFMLAKLPIKLTNTPQIEKPDVIFLLDTNTIQQLDAWAERVKTTKAPIIVIDHHAAHPETQKLATLCMADENAASTCEIVYKFYKDLQLALSKDEAKALFLGIAFDTRHFILAKSVTFKIIADLIDAGVNVEESLSLLSLPMEESERIARLKASRRVKLLKINGWIVALSHVSAYQASAARALISLGAHVAAVAGQRNDTLRISLRATNEFYQQSKVHLGRDIAKPLGEYLQGMGGGHSVSAGANGRGDAEASLKRCVHLLREKLTPI